MSGVAMIGFGEVGGHDGGRARRHGPDIGSSTVHQSCGEVLTGQEIVDTPVVPG